MESAEAFICGLLAKADVEVGGSRTWDIVVHDSRLYPRLLRDPALGLGESYMDGWWDCDDIADCIRRILLARLERVISPRKLLLQALRARLFNMQSKDRAARDVSAHYDLGNVLFRAMLDKRMTYSCGYWKEATDLDAAQEAKLDLVCRKIGLREGQRVLDIGCGWGSFLKFAAERYGAVGVGVTLSKEQVALGREMCAGFPVELRVQDYRDVNERFDHVVSIGMFEHVGPANYLTFMRVVEKNLEDDGLFLLHTIGANRSNMKADTWTDRYIFPGGQLPSAEQIPAASSDIFTLEDWHNFGVYYADTLDAWYANFEAHWEGELDQHYDRRFYRMWKYFLLSSSGAFRMRRDQLWQIVFSKRGVQGGYEAVR